MQSQLFDTAPFTVPQASGWVYAVWMPSRAIKLGWTGRDPPVRARELGGELLRAWPGTLDDEAAVHRAFGDYRIGRTEDFWPVPAVWRFLDLPASLALVG